MFHSNITKKILNSAYLDMIGNQSFKQMLCTVCECLGDDSKAVTDAGNDDQGDADDNQGD